MAVQVASIVTGYPSITFVKHNTFIQLPLFFHRHGWIGAIRTTVPFDSTDKADHWAAFRLIPGLRRVLLLMLKRVLLLMSRRTVVLRISVSSVIAHRLRLIAGLRRWLRVSLVAAELIRSLQLTIILS